MGYESRIYVVEKSNIKEPEGFWCEVIATVNMCKTNADFVNLFDTEFDGYFYDAVCITEDKYGKKLTVADKDSVVNYLETRVNDYRRYKILYNLLKGFDEESWDNLCIVHYGY